MNNVNFFRHSFSRLRCVTLAFIITLLSACSLVPQSSAPTVTVAENTELALPTPSSLGYQLSASQLITASWVIDNKTTSEQLPVQLQITTHDVVLAGFSSWGTRILSLSYDGKTINTEVLSGLQSTLPQPEQVLFNLMLTLWPTSTWEAPLHQIGWRIIENNNTRTVFDSHGEKIIEIHYSHADKLKGKIEYHHLRDQFSITIQTLQYQRH